MWLSISSCRIVKMTIEIYGHYSPPAKKPITKQFFINSFSLPNGENSGQEKVSFGDEPIEDYPSLVSLIMYYKSKNETEQMCGGTLITDQHILTAAHCWGAANTKTFKAVLGSRHKFHAENDDGDAIEFERDSVSIHPYYSGPIDYAHDTAVVTLPRKVKQSSAIKPIRLAKKVYKDNVRVVGWGRKDCKGGLPDRYLYAKGWIVDYKECEKAWNDFLHESHICAKFKNNKGDDTGSDRGDSGGPLLATAADGKDVQIGIVCKSLKKYQPKVCTKVSVPMVYTKVPGDEKFIKSIAPSAEFV
ncbi:unnamed protein product [Allacma fusca]|uniref:Peptidase S1 domain-containing protein n=1 Tax=Allacma fusca TaxID=39272 RepID=A0A8J2JAW4_9HEXA|nr:unnamed protein product [Allacma fusca]